MSPLVLALPGAETLASRLARELDWERGLVAVRAFPDEESLVTLQADPTGRPVFLVASLRGPDPRFLPLAFAADTAWELGAERVVLVAPYLPYMRQDVRFHAGEAISSRTFARLVSRLVDGLITVDPHLHRFTSLDQLYTIPTTVVAAAPAVAGWLQAEVPDATLVGPDGESEQWVKDVARRAGLPWAVLGKVRAGDREVSFSGLGEIAGRCAGRTPVLLDDIVSSGGTLARAAAALRAAGTRPPVCVAVHAVFAPGAHPALLEAAPARVVTTNTIPHSTNAIDVIPALARACRELLGPA